MLPHIHFLSGLILAGFLFYFFPVIGLIGFLIIVFSGIFIDIDHYFFYIYQKKNLNLISAYRWFVKKGNFLKKLPREKRAEYFRGFYIFHGIEILFFLFLLGIFLNKYFLLISVSFMLHLSLDYIYQLNLWDRLDKISVIYDFIKFRK